MASVTAKDQHLRAHRRTAQQAYLSTHQHRPVPGMLTPTAVAF